MMTKAEVFDLGEFEALWAESTKPSWKPDTLKKGEMTASMYTRWIFEKTGKRISVGRARELLNGMVKSNCATRREVCLESPRHWNWAYLPIKPKK